MLQVFLPIISVKQASDGETRSIAGKSMKEKKYQWWIERFQKTFELFDIVRIDHFRGFESYWEVSAKEETAVHGNWRTGTGGRVFQNSPQKNRKTSHSLRKIWVS